MPPSASSSSPGAARRAALLLRRSSRGSRRGGREDPTASTDDVRASRTVVGGVASIPSRAASLAQVVTSVIGQLDHLYVFLNGYPDVPPFLDDPRITVFRSQDHGDLADNGKFFGAQSHDDAIYLGLDDDLAYPTDYVDRLLAALAHVRFSGVVGVHGAIYPEAPESFVDRNSLSFHVSNAELVPVSLLGTGTIALALDRVPVEPAWFPSPRMADIWLAKALKERRIPLFAVPRPEGWLTEIDDEARQPGIWEEARKDGRELTRVIVDQRPWGLADLLERLASAGIDEVAPMWRRFRRFLDVASEEGMAAAVERATAPRRLARYLTLFLEPGELMEVCATALAHRGPDDPLFDGTIRAALRHDPYRSAELLRTAAGTTLPADPGAAIRRFAQASRAFRLAGDAPSAAATLREAPPELHREVAWIDEAIAVSIEVQDHPRAHELLTTNANRLDRNHTYDYRMAITTTATHSLDDAAPWIASLLLEERATRLQARLISKLRAWRDPDRGLHRQASLQVVESACADGTLDPLPTIHLYLACGERVAARRLFETTAPRIERVRPGYVPLLRSAMATSPEAALGHLNTYFISEDLAPLSLRDTPQARFLGRLAGPRLPAADPGARVSIIVTAFNSQDTIEYAVRSILEQSVGDIEVLIVDDRSTDATPTLIADLAASDSRIVPLSSPRNQGPYACRNLALDQATGDFIGIHDADDLAHPQRLAHQIAHLTDGDAVASYVGHLRITDDGHVVPENHGGLVGEGPMTLLARREVFDDLGYFLPVRSRGDIEHRHRMIAYYGAHRVDLHSTVLLLARDATASNSRQVDADPAKTAASERTKVQGRVRHREARGQREALYVDARGSTTGLSSAGDRVR